MNTPSYTAENKRVWRETIKSNQIFLEEYQDYIYQPYLDGFRRLGFDADQLPTIQTLTEALKPICWSPVFVDGYLPTKAYIDLLAERKVPISSQMRSFQHISYAPRPDLIHDLIGHLPMLFCNDYVEYLKALCECFSLVQPNIYDIRLYDAQKKLAQLDHNSANAKLIAKATNEVGNAEKKLKNNPSSEYNLGKLFLWTIEFGLMKDNSLPKIYGAGLMSSSLEVRAICEGKIRILPFELENITKDFHFSDLQDQVFVAKSFQSLREILSIYKNEIAA